MRLKAELRQPSAADEPLIRIAARATSTVPDVCLNAIAGAVGGQGVTMQAVDK